MRGLHDSFIEDVCLVGFRKFVLGSGPQSVYCCNRSEEETKCVSVSVRALMRKEYGLRIWNPAVPDEAFVQP